MSCLHRSTILVAVLSDPYDADLGYLCIGLVLCHWIDSRALRSRQYDGDNIIKWILLILDLSLIFFWQTIFSPRKESNYPTQHQTIAVSQ